MQVRTLVPVAALFLSMMAPSTARAEVCAIGDVSAKCSVANVNDVNFGAVSPFSSEDVTATTVITVTCTCDQTVRVRLGLNGGLGQVVLARRLQRTGGSDALQYHLTQPSDPSTEWGDDGSISAVLVSVTGTQDVSVLARIQIDQAKRAPVGAYSDDVKAWVVSAFLN